MQSCSHAVVQSCSRAVFKLCICEVKLKSLINPPSRSASADEKFWFNSLGLAPEDCVQSLLWGLIPFITIKDFGFKDQILQLQDL
jgi:hypothetical protein